MQERNESVAPSPTVLPAKSDSDVMFGYKVIRDFRIDRSLVY